VENARWGLVSRAWRLSSHGVSPFHPAPASCSSGQGSSPSCTSAPSFRFNITPSLSPFGYGRAFQNPPSPGAQQFCSRSQLKKVTEVRCQHYVEVYGALTTRQFSSRLARRALCRVWLPPSRSSTKQSKKKTNFAKKRRKKKKKGRPSAPTDRFPLLCSFQAHVICALSCCVARTAAFQRAPCTA
jgi:hypothetical protein